MAGNGNSGRPAKPPALHILQGNRSKKNFEEMINEIKAPPVPVAAPPMPSFLNDEAVLEWERVVPDLIALGLIATLDLMALATYCQAYGDWLRFQRLIAQKNADSVDGLGGDVQTFKTGAQQLHVLRQLANDAEKRANAAGAQFGFSPMARRNLKTAPAPQGELFPNEQRDAASRYFT
jgi:P27 family predicted phage terminase small subunit